MSDESTRKVGLGSLRIVSPAEQLTGVAPAAFERATGACSAGDATHRGLIHVCANMARYALDACTPPGACVPIIAGGDTAVAWALERADLSAVRKARNEAFNGIIGAERKTLEMIRRMLAQQEPNPHTQLDPHADQVVLRYAGLAANYACGAALMTLDGIEQPRLLGSIPQQIAGALAYAATGLGPARSGRLRASAWKQAEWEATRVAAGGGHDERALAVQVFHEFVGSLWKEQSDGQRIRLGEFAEWAISAS